MRWWQADNRRGGRMRCARQIRQPHEPVSPVWRLTRSVGRRHGSNGAGTRRRAQALNWIRRIDGALHHCRRRRRLPRRIVARRLFKGASRNAPLGGELSRSSPSSPTSPLSPPGWHWSCLTRGSRGGGAACERSLAKSACASSRHPTTSTMCAAGLANANPL
jgi:hypothetical protein